VCGLHTEGPSGPGALREKSRKDAAFFLENLSVSSVAKSVGNGNETIAI
jgi:hypothetical protein